MIHGPEPFRVILYSLQMEGSHYEETGVSDSGWSDRVLTSYVADRIGANEVLRQTDP